MTNDVISARVLHLRRAGTSAVLEIDSSGAPVLHYWGPDLGVSAAAAVEALARANRPQHRVGDVDEPQLVSLVPAAAEGWTGAPGLLGHRAGRFFSQAFAAVTVDADDAAARVSCVERDSGLRLEIELEVTQAGLLRQRLTVVNEGAGPFDVQELSVSLPLPDWCGEVLDLTGRWMRERVPQRHALSVGRFLRESRKGRPGADASLLLIAGETGFDFERGAVRAMHVAWSGNHRLAVERTVLGGSVLSGGELLLAGEGLLQHGESYATPWVYGGWGDGLDDLADRFHDEIRAASRPTEGPRPVLLNVWEAVYFNHQLEPLRNLADRAAEVGAELYVLDDGWFLGRRDDRRALGDWFVDPTVWPDGLEPIISHVRSRGLRFGIWVEPEMVSVESRLASQHPEWILRPGQRMPKVGKWQHVLNAANPEVYAYLLERLDWLLANHDISYLKWDHNRDAIEPGDLASGCAAMHAHVDAVYRLIDELRDRHPQVDFENCASGGSRIDMEILRRTERTWISDCADPMERARVQLYTGLLMPLDMIGNDIAVAESHTTGRTSHLDLRGTVALLGWLGVQWDLNSASPQELADLAAWIAFHKEHRDLIHTGLARTLRCADDAVIARAVVARDRSAALVTITQLTSTLAPSAGRIRIPGLDSDACYEVSVVTPASTGLRTMAYTEVPWVRDGVTLTGRMLALAGLELPVLNPEQGVVVSVRRV